jgi:hypothetical protein
MKRALILVLLASLAGLIWFSHRLAGVRIYHADECQNVFMARIIASGQTKAFYTDAGLLQAGLLAWLARGASTSIDLFVAGRFVMLELFWLNIVLLALATGERLLSRRGLIALVGAATLAPLWDFGFEIRPDNLLLCGVLLMWSIVRVRPKGLQPFILAGALTAGLQFVTFEAFAFTLPISAAILAFPPTNQPSPRWRLGLAWTAGALGTLLLLRVGYGAAGLWDVYVANLHAALGNSSLGNRFGPGAALGRLLVQTPLLLAVVAAALLAAASDVQRRGKQALSWDSALPEALLVLVALAVLLINPAPEPYNLLHLVPYAYLLAFRYASGIGMELWSRVALRPVLVALLVFAYAVPFGLATWRHVSFTNYHQEARIRVVEELTDPAKDAVYDGIGLVPVRPSIGFYWPLPGTNRPSLAEAQGLRVRDMLAARPAAVIMPNYRTDGLPEADHAFIKERYVPATDDLWVLGKVLPAGGGTFEVIHPGRYRISSLEGSDLAGTYPEGLAGLLAPVVEGTLDGTLDGVPLTNRSVELTVGTHRIETTSESQPAVVWMGPRKNRMGRLGESDHRFLFVRWY